MLAFLKQSKTIVTLVHLWPFLKPERRRLGYAILVTLGLTGAEILFPVLIGFFVDALLREIRDPIGYPFSGWSEYRVVIALLVIAIARGGLTAWQRGLMGRIGQQVAARIRRKLWRHLQLLPLDYLRRRGPGRLLLRFTSDARAVQRLVTNGVVVVTQDLLVAIGVLIVLVLVNWRMSLALLLLAPIFGILFWQFNPRLQEASRATRRRRSILSAYLNDRLIGMMMVKAHGGHEDEVAAFAGKNRILARRGTTLAVIGGRLQGLATLVVALSSVVVLALASHELAAGRLSGGQLVTFYTLVVMLGPILQRMTTADRTLQEAQISVERLAATLMEPPEGREDTGQPSLKVAAGLVTYTDVSFTFPDGTAVLNGVSLQARRGEVVALLGANGAGKTTLLELLLRFRALTGGAITIDGQNIDQVALASLRAQVGLVGQELPLFTGTLAENVTYGSQELPEGRLDEIARQTGLDQLVAGLPDGWETRLSEGRRALSNGQRQRVALARALISDPPILLLDEATASLDMAAEEAFMRTLRQLAREKTVIIATHRQAALLAADRVYRLEEGRATELTPAAHSIAPGEGGAYERCSACPGGEEVSACPEHRDTRGGALLIAEH